MRAQFWQALTAGAAGHFAGAFWDWRFPQTWPDHVMDPGAGEWLIARNFFAARSWWTLRGDHPATIVVSGAGTYASTGSGQDNDYATAARSVDGSLIVIYVPSSRTFTVDTTRLAGAANATWHDPTTGTSAFAGAVNNTGTQVFTPPPDVHADGTTDWVLELVVP